MPEITAAMVKALRDKTGQGMMECKKALTESDGDVEAAVDLLRKRGMASAASKADRAATEGLVAVHVGDGAAVMIEVLCETDFCARNDEFKAMVQQVADLAAAADADGPIDASEPITAAVQACFNKIGENMRYGRGVRISAPTIGHYVHHNGKVGVLIGIDGDVDDDLLLGLCMHIAMAEPMAITPEEVPADVVERERRVAMEAAAETGKPAPILEKIVEGKVRKFLADRALMEQAYIRDEKKKIKQVLGPAKVTAFARFAVGK